MADTLSLPEQWLLLCLNDTTGTSEEVSIRKGLDGAIIAELMLRGSLTLDAKKRLTALETLPPDDPLMRQALDRIKGSRPRILDEWLGRLIPDSPLKSQPAVQERVAERLVEQGVLTRNEIRHLWVIPDQVYPTRDGRPEAELRERLRSALLGDQPVDERLTVLIALMHGNFALDRVLSKEEAAACEPRVRALCEGMLHAAIAAPASPEAIRASQNAEAVGFFLGIGEMIVGLAGLTQ